MQESKYKVTNLFSLVKDEGKSTKRSQSLVYAYRNYEGPVLLAHLQILIKALVVSR